MTLVERLAKLWSVSDVPPARVNLIALVSMGMTTYGGIAQGTRATTKRACELVGHYRVPVVYGDYLPNPGPLEIWFKWAKLPVNIYAGQVTTTIDECLAFKAKCPWAKRVILVTEEVHSRRAKIIWRCLWPEAEIFVVSVPLREVIDADSIMGTYRSPWRALIMQAGPTPIYKLMAMLGPKALMLLMDFHQPIAR